MVDAPLGFEDLPAAVGRVLHGEPFTLDPEDSHRFHQATWLDKAYPEDDPDFPETLVEGFWLLAMVDAVSRLSQGGGPDSMWGLNYGLDRVRFISPVHLGDVIHPSFQIREVTPKDGGYKVLRRCTFQVEGATVPAMVADWWSYVLPRGVVEKGRRTD